MNFENRNLSILRAMTAVFTVLTIIIGSLKAQGTSAGKLDKEIDAYFSDKIPANGPGAVVLAVKNGEIILRKSYGMSNIELGVTMKPEMVFRIGSITKQFTAACIMMLVDEGKVSLNDEITKYIPDYPTKGNKITIHHLLNHTSGIKSWDDVENYYFNIRKDYQPDDFVDLFKNEPIDFKPGEQFKYNNSGYFLLGVIIEKVSGMRYGEFINYRIFKPLGMKNSYYGSLNRIIPNRAAGYQSKKDGFVNADFLSMTQIYAAGALLSTADDLWTWTKAIHSGRVVTKQSFEMMTTPTTYGDNQIMNYGYGLWLNTLFGEKLVEHNGGINGFLAHLLYLPEKNIFVTVLTNALIIVDAPFLAQWTAATLCAKDVKRKTAIMLDTKILDEIIGIYELSQVDIITLTRERNKLFFQKTGKPKLEAFASSENEFFFQDSFSHFTIVRDEDGKVDKVVIHNQEHDEVAIKTEKKIFKLDVKQFKAYEGIYVSEDGIEITIKQGDGKFIAQLKGQPEFEIIPESKNIFYFTVADAQLEFIEDGIGEVTIVKIHQGGRSLTLKRK